MNRHIAAGTMTEGCSPYHAAFFSVKQSLIKAIFSEAGCFKKIAKGTDVNIRLGY